MGSCVYVASDFVELCCAARPGVHQDPHLDVDYHHLVPSEYFVPPQKALKPGELEPARSLGFGWEAFRTPPSRPAPSPHLPGQRCTMPKHGGATTTATVAEVAIKLGLVATIIGWVLGSW